MAYNWRKHVEHVVVPRAMNRDFVVSELVCMLSCLNRLREWTISPSSHSAFSDGFLFEPASLPESWRFLQWRILWISVIEM